MLSVSTCILVNYDFNSSHGNDKDFNRKSICCTTGRWPANFSSNDFTFVVFLTKKKLFPHHFQRISCNCFKKPKSKFHGNTRTGLHRPNSLIRHIVPLLDSGINENVELCMRISPSMSWRISPAATDVEGKNQPISCLKKRQSWLVGR